MDFTSALYLGMTHSSCSLAPWKYLTAGRPDALGIPRRNRRLAAGLAAIVDCEKVALGQSTFHLFWDLFNILAKDRIAIYFDRSAYPIAHWGAACAVKGGVPVRSFPHLDPEALRQQLSYNNLRSRRPVVVTDGYCPACGKHAPLGAYLDIVKPVGGRLVIDDTQAIGIWGRHPNALNSYGRGGGGSLHRQRIKDSQIILVSSLAKAFGVPIGMIAGSKPFIRRFMAQSETRIHCSPPSAAEVSAAEQALAINAVHGDALRRRLSRLVLYFKRQLNRIAMAATQGYFPVQPLICHSVNSSQLLYNRLQRLGVKAVLSRHCRNPRPQLNFIITARHSFADIMKVVRLMAYSTSNNGRTNKLRRLGYAL